MSQTESPKKSEKVSNIIMPNTYVQGEQNHLSGKRLFPHSIRLALFDTKARQGNYKKTTDQHPS